MALGLSEFRAALAGIGSTHDETRRAADQWLQHFQMSQEAWVICGEACNDVNSDSTCLFFAASILHNKIRSDFHDLPFESIEPLRNSILTTMDRLFSIDETPTNVLSKLCQAISALAVQSCWDGIFHIAFSNSSSEKHLRLVLQMLKELPFECHTRKLVIRTDTRNNFKFILHQKTQEVIKFLGSIAENLQNFADENHSIKINLFECFGVWVYYCSIPVEELVQSPVIPALFNSIWNYNDNQEVFEASIDAIIDILREYPGTEKNFTLAGIVVPSIMGLKDLYSRAGESGDFEVQHGLSRIFTEMAEAHVELLVSEVDLNQSLVIGILLDCCQHENHETAEIPLYFFYRLAKTLQKIENDDLRRRRIDFFSPAYTNILNICMNLCRFPPDVERFTENQLGEFCDFRNNVADSFRDCCTILGTDQCIQLVSGTVQSCIDQYTSNPTLWQSLESAFYAFQHICQFMSDEYEHNHQVNTTIPTNYQQKVNDFIPNLLVMLLQICPLNNTNVFLLQQTTIEIMGNCATLLSDCNNSQLIQNLCLFLLSALQFPKCSKNASLSLKNLLERLNATQVGGFPAIVELFTQLTILKGQIKLDYELAALKGLVSISNTLPFAENLQTLQSFLQPVIISVEASVDSEPQVIKAELQRLNTIISKASIPVPDGQKQPLFDLIQHLFPTFESILNRHQTNESIVEKVCKSYKSFIRVCEKDFAPLLLPLTQSITNKYSTTLLSPYMYAGSICITEFADEVEYHPLLAAMIESFIHSTLPSIQTLELAKENPNIVEDFFILMDRCIRHMPLTALQIPTIPQVIVCALNSVLLDHQDANLRVLQFFDSMINLAYSNEKHQFDDNTLALVRNAISHILDTFGESLVEHIFIVLTSGSTPTIALDNDTGSVVTILNSLYDFDKDRFQNWIFLTLQQITEEVISNNEKREFTDEIFTSQLSEKDFEDILIHFSEIWRQNAKVVKK